MELGSTKRWSFLIVIKFRMLIWGLILRNKSIPLLKIFLPKSIFVIIKENKKNLKINLKSQPLHTNQDKSKVPAFWLLNLQSKKRKRNSSPLKIRPNRRWQIVYSEVV